MTPALQLALGTPPSGVTEAPVGQNSLDSVVHSALAELSAAGVDPLLLAKLAKANYEMANLSGDELGLTYQSSDTVLINATAAGFGWYTGTAAGSVRQERDTWTCSPPSCMRWDTSLAFLTPPPLTASWPSISLLVSDAPMLSTRFSLASEMRNGARSG